MPMNGWFVELWKDTIQFRLRGMVLEISVFKVTAPEVFGNSAFCMMLVPSIVFYITVIKSYFTFGSLFINFVGRFQNICCTYE